MRFVCIHGVSHGGWCWDQLRLGLERLGHEVVTPDLPLTSPEADADVVSDVLDASPDPVVLVGHSYGGLVISKAAAGRNNVGRLVFVAAVMVEADDVFFDVAMNYPTPLIDHTVFADNGTYTVDAAGAIRSFYGNCHRRSPPLPRVDCEPRRWRVSPVRRAPRPGATSHPLTFCARRTRQSPLIGRKR